MNSGKTTALLQVAFNYKERGMRVVILKASIDTKGGDAIVSRLGVSCKVDHLVRPETDIFALIEADIEANGRPACVLCDESQFFTPAQAEQLFLVTVDLGIPVICYGLRADFMMRGFPGSTRLLELAHSIEEMKTICACGRKAMCNGARSTDSLCSRARRSQSTRWTPSSMKASAPSAGTENTALFWPAKRKKGPIDPSQSICTDKSAALPSQRMQGSAFVHGRTLASAFFVDAPEKTGGTAAAKSRSPP